MFLRRLLRALPDAQVTGPDDVEIHDITYDSRQVIPGSLFVAVPSVGGDAHSGGHRFLGEATRRGAVAVVLQGHRELDRVTTVSVPDTRSALADLSAEFFDHPSRAVQLYAVTGTDGKTTTTYLLEQVFASAGYCTGLIGTVEVKIGDRREQNTERMTTPESLDVQCLLRHMDAEGVTHVVIEASSHALALQRLRACRFAACALTNITGDHLEFHGSWEAYFQAKASLFVELGNGRPAVLNRDDEHYDRLAALMSRPIVSYGMHPDAQIRATNIALGRRDARCTVQVGDRRADLRVPLPGAFNVSNALATAGLALSAGLSLDEISEGLHRAQPPPGRMQSVTDGQPFDVLIDYAHTTHAFRSVLATLRERTCSPGRIIAVFGAAGNRDHAKRPRLAHIAREYADFFIITNEDPFGEIATDIVDDIAAGLPKDEEGVRFRREIDRGRAIELAVEQARPGDTVVILGKGHEQSIVANGRKEPWSDVEAVRRTLRNLR